MDTRILEIILRAKDEASAAVDKASSNISKSLDKAKGASTLFTGAVVAAGVAIMAVANQAGDYEQALNVFQSVSGATAAQMQQVASTARALGNDLSLPGISAKDAAFAMVELSKAGLSVNDSLAASKGVLSLAKAGQLETAEAAEIAANALNAFSLKGSEASRVADILAAAANASSADVSDLAYGLQMSSASAAAMKVPIDDLVALLAEMSNNGIQGSDAGTSLKTMMMRLIPASDAAAASMKKLNLDFFDAKGNFVGMREVSKQLEAGTRNLTDEQKNFHLQTIFGSDALRAANVIAKEGVKGFDSLSAAVNASGAATKLAAAQNSGFKGALDGLISTFETIAIDVGNKLLPYLTAFISLISEHGDEIGAAIMGFVDWAIANWPILAGIIIGGMVPALYAMAVAFGANVIALAPFLAIGAAIGLLAKVIMDNWGPISSFFTTLWTTVTGVFQAVVDWFREKIDWFKDHWAEAIGFVIGFFATLPFTLPFLVATAIYKIIELLAKIDWGAVFASIGVAFGKVWDTIKATAINVFNYLKSINWGELLSSIGRGIGNAIIGLIEGAIKGATAGIPVIGDAMKNLHIPRFEKGIENFAGGLAYVHQGEVLANLAPGTTVIPKDEVNGRMAGVNITINANVSKEVDIQQLGQRLAWEMKLAGGF